MAFCFGAHGPQVIHRFTTWAFNGESDKFALTKFFGTSSTTDILHFHSDEKYDSLGAPVHR